MGIKEEIFREYDIRGVVGRDLNAVTAEGIGRAFGAYLKGIYPEARTVSVGRDVRLGSEELLRGLIKGILSTGLSIFNIGECPTPLQYFSIHHLNLDGGVMVTGSHNPPEYNGFKLSAGRETLYGGAIQAIKRIILSEGWHVPAEAGKTEPYDIIRAYSGYMLDEFGYLSGSRYRRLKVVVDAGNGTAGLVVPDLLSRLGCEVMPLYCEPDGRFPNHHPDPTVVEYIYDLINTTQKAGADFGVGYDGDADRIGLVDRDGNIIWGDQLIVILSREILRGHPGAKVIGDVKCSQVMFDDIKKHGGVPIMWKTGHSLIKQKMREEGALLAGEFSGHIFISDRYFGYDDAVYTTLRLVEIMKLRNMGLKDLLSDIPKMHFTPEIRIECDEGIKGKVVEDIVSNFIKYQSEGGSPCRIIDLNLTDGVRVVFDRGWGLIRMSNTQPVVVMRVEAGDEESLSAYRVFLERELKVIMDESRLRG